MKNLYQAETFEEVKGRVASLRPDSGRQWGKMNVAQMLAHCSIGLEMGMGEFNPPRTLIGRVLGGVIKKLALRDDEPIRRNTPTVDGMVITDSREFMTEQQRLSGLLDQYKAAGPQGCTTHPHAFFGELTADEWGVLMYKHLDHHLRQFGV